MARLNVPSHVSDHMVLYRKPDPITVARIVDGYSSDAASERWSSLSPSTIAKIAQEGRRRLAAHGADDSSRMRDCSSCGHPFYSASSRNVVCRICRSENAGDFS